MGAISPSPTRRPAWLSDDLGALPNPQPPWGADLLYQELRGEAYRAARQRGRHAKTE